MGQELKPNAVVQSEDEHLDKMVAVKETHEAGQEVNPDQKEAFVNHEGLKRVYKPKPKQ